MTPEPQVVHGEIAALTFQVARPLIWHDRTEGWPKRLDGGTCFFLRFERWIIGVTANHFVSAYESAIAANPNSVCQLRNSPAFDLVGAIISRDAARDIATFAVSETVLSHIEAVPLDCRGSWPPPEPQNLWLLSVCGFPESMRIPRADRSAEFRAWGALAAVECVTRDEILITYDPAIVKPTAWAPRLPALGFNLSGCSGGPVLANGTWNGLHRWFAVGLVAEGPREQAKQGASAEFDMIRLRASTSSSQTARSDSRQTIPPAGCRGRGRAAANQDSRIDRLRTYRLSVHCDFFHFVIFFAVDRRRFGCTFSLFIFSPKVLVVSRIRTLSSVPFSSWRISSTSLLAHRQKASKPMRVIIKASPPASGPSRTP